MARIVSLLVSPQQLYVGRPDPLVHSEESDLVTVITLRAGLGVVGDRYFNQPAHRFASVTVMASESLSGRPGIGLLQARRNILLEGVDVDAAAPGDLLVLDSGAGEVGLRINRPATPCRWMDAAIGPGAWRELRGRGGKRCTPETDGELRLGPVTARWLSARNR